ncbi:hypothetical protein Asp14428_47340 [Actinoplanes sp. NBRC 14428]|nr:hypothetical protein Asp14428_47340 [Actinoplanes sp. NBRC 14428]
MTGAEFSEVDFDLLADYVGGALDGTPDEAVVAALIVGHPGWRRAHAELDAAAGAMTSALRSWGEEPEPMPAEFVARLDAAFAAEAAGGGEAGSGSAASGSSPRAGEFDVAASGAIHSAPGGDAAAPGRHLVAVPDGEERATTARKRVRRWKWAAPAGIAAGVLAFVGFGVQQLGGADSADDSSAAGSAQGAEHALALPAGPGQILSSGIDYNRGTLAQAAAQALSAPADTGQTGSAPRAPGQQPPVPRTGAADDSRNKGAEPTGGVMAERNEALDRLRVREALLACLDAIAGANGAGPVTAQTIDYARYEGAPALIVQFTAANGSWVWAAGAGCGTPASGADKLGSAKVG